MSGNIFRGNLTASLAIFTDLHVALWDSHSLNSCNKYCSETTYWIVNSGSGGMMVLDEILLLPSQPKQGVSDRLTDGGSGQGEISQEMEQERILKQE